LFESSIKVSTSCGWVAAACAVPIAFAFSGRPAVSAYRHRILSGGPSTRSLSLHE
jgi:hypothetical protein